MNNTFGCYDRGTLGHVLNSLVEYGISVRIVGDIKFGKDTHNGRNLLHYQGKEFGHYRYIDGIEQPLFYFQDPVYLSQTNYYGNHQLVLYVHGSASLVMHKHPSPRIVHETIRRCLTNYMPDEFYKLQQDAGAFFQGGSENPDGDFFYVEFWKPQGAQAWVDGFNRELQKRLAEEKCRIDNL